MAETPIFTATTTEGRELAVDYERRRLLTIVSNLLLLAFGVACLWKGITETRIGFSIDAFYFYFLFLLCIAVFFYLPIFSGNLRSDLWKRKNPSGKREYRFYEDRFEISTDDAWTLYQYNQLRRVVESKLQFALVFPGNLVFSVEKSGFTEGSPADFSAFIIKKAENNSLSI